MNWLRLFFSLTAAYVFYNLFTLFQNYRKARRSGLPIVVLPIPYRSIPWLLLGRSLRPFFKWIFPTALFEYVDVGIMGWEFRSRGSGGVKRLDIFGSRTKGKTKNFVLCTCSTPNIIYVGAPDLAFDILKRTKDFESSDDTVKFMGIFGPTLASTRGEQWAKQRRLIAPQINEQYSRIVFDESQRQAREMLDHFAALPDPATEDTLVGLRRIAINVLVAAGYGVSQSWEENKPDTMTTEDFGPRMNYIRATRQVVNAFPEAFVLPGSVLRLPIFPAPTRSVGRAVQNFPLYAKEMLAHERERIESSKVEGKRGHFLEMLVKQLDKNKGNEKGGVASHAQSASIPSVQTLSEDEVSGNLFGFTVAGFETTANTLGFAVTLLAARPEWQEWLIEEIDEVVKGRSEADLDYAEVYPELKRCLAVMHETLRLFNPVIHLAKQARFPSTVQTSNDMYHFEPKEEVYINQYAIQTDPDVWGPDALEFKPSRWLPDQKKVGASDVSDAGSALAKGAFLPWSSGPRICPGMKFSQVEFVSVVMTIFRKYRIEPVMKKGQTKEQACDRLYEIMEAAEHKLTLEIGRPKEVELRYLRRR